MNTNNVATLYLDCDTSKKNHPLPWTTITQPTYHHNHTLAVKSNIIFRI